MNETSDSDSIPADNDPVDRNSAEQAEDSSSAVPESCAEEPTAAPSPTDSATSALMNAQEKQPPILPRELIVVLLLVILCDVTIYRGKGFAGWALFFATAPVLLLLGRTGISRGIELYVVGALELILAIKLVWSGSWLLVAAGFSLLVAFSMTMAGQLPFVLETLVFAFSTVPSGYRGLALYKRSASRFNITINRGPALNVTLPLVTLLAFGLLFLMANPDLRAAFGETVERFLKTLSEWIVNFSPHLSEIFFWILVLWLSVGLLRPMIGTISNGVWNNMSRTNDETDSTPIKSPLYSPIRNTLFTVIALFAVYLTFEYKTLWLRVFPKGFYYSGYAHEGAAWLTASLALATLVLSLLFKGRILNDPRLPHLRKLAWIWSVENLLLAIAVYHRLYIYMGFNGLSRMRIVAIHGITAVMFGFILVVWKIVHNKDFTWLIRRHLWVLALVIYIFAVLPVDRIVTGYNVRRILSGDPAPSVQISVHPIGPEGILLLIPLLSCEDEKIREGIQAVLGGHLQKAMNLAESRKKFGWTTYQIADRIVYERLIEDGSEWGPYWNPALRIPALKRFSQYTHQWY